jgi:hypothetical protein
MKSLNEKSSKRTDDDRVSLEMESILDDEGIRSDAVRKLF